MAERARTSPDLNRWQRLAVALISVALLAALLALLVGAAVRLWAWAL